MLNKLNNFLTAMITPDTVEVRPENTLQLATAVLLIEIMRSYADSTGEAKATLLKIRKERFDLSDTEWVHQTEPGTRQEHAEQHLCRVDDGVETLLLLGGAFVPDHPVV